MIKGLTQNEVENRIKEGKTNTVVEIERKSYGRIISDNVFTFFNLINVIVFILVLSQGSLKNSLFMGVVISNTIIGIIDEALLKKKLDKLSYLKEKKTTVVRESKKIEILSTEIVVDDVIYIKPGDEIPCDSLVLETEFFEVNEALLTGEEESIKKDKANGHLLSGSFAVSGECYARAIKVGKENFANEIISEAKKYKKIDSQIVNSIDKIIKIMTISILPLGMLLFASSYFRDGKSINEAILGVAGSIIGMIPSGLYLITTITASVSIMKLIRRRALVTEFSAIEMLARVGTICLDKTGTLTTGEMELVKTIEYDKSYIDIIKLIIKTFDNKNPTLKAIEKSFGGRTNLTADSKIPFSSERKYLEVTTAGKTYHLGGVDILTTDSEILDTAKEFTQKGKRVLLLINNETPLCLFVISDILKKNAKEVLTYFEKQSVNLKIISGDNPLAVSSIAKQLGFSGSEKYIDMQNQLEVNIPKITAKYSIFGRVSPSQKKLIIKSLREDGKTVAMVGDGVNDILALKEADLAIAMANGSDAAKSVAQVTLIDSDFAPLPSILSEGRRIVNNIESVASLYLTKTIFSVIITILFIILGQNYPLEPIALTIIGVTTIGLPSFLLAFRSNDKMVQGDFLKLILKNSLPTGCLIGVFVGFLGILNLIGSIGNPEIMAFYVTAYFCFVKLIKTSLPFDYYKAGVVSVMLFLFCGSLFLPQVLEISRLSGSNMLMLSAILITGTVLLAFEQHE